MSDEDVKQLIREISALAQEVKGLKDTVKGMHRALFGEEGTGGLAGSLQYQTSRLDALEHEHKKLRKEHDEQRCAEHEQAKEQAKEQAQAGLINLPQAFLCFFLNV